MKTFFINNDCIEYINRKLNMQFEVRISKEIDKYSWKYGNLIPIGYDYKLQEKFWRFLIEYYRIKYYNKDYFVNPIYSVNKDFLEIKINIETYSTEDIIDEYYEKIPIVSVDEAHFNKNFGPNSETYALIWANFIQIPKFDKWNHPQYYSPLLASIRNYVLNKLITATINRETEVTIMNPFSIRFDKNFDIIADFISIKLDYGIKLTNYYIHYAYYTDRVNLNMLNKIDSNTFCYEYIRRYCVLLCRTSRKTYSICIINMYDSAYSDLEQLLSNLSDIMCKINKDPFIKLIKGAKRILPQSVACLFNKSKIYKIPRLLSIYGIVNQKHAFERLLLQNL